MADFEPAMEVLIRHEVYHYGRPDQISWSCAKGDKGGETNWGWSSSTIANLGLKPADLDVPGPVTFGWLREMPEKRARELYLRYFWAPYRYQDIADQNIATKVFDFAVNANPYQAGMLVQTALASLGVAVDIDGRIGPQTVGLLNVCHADLVMPKLVENQSAYYRRLVDEGHRRALAAHAAGDPNWQSHEQGQFLDGWLKRASWIGGLP